MKGWTLIIVHPFFNMSLVNYIVKGYQEQEGIYNNPTFTCLPNSTINATLSGSFPFNPSVTEFNRALDSGGYNIVKLMTATVRNYSVDAYDNLIPVFPSGSYPVEQQIITNNVDGLKYRIESIRWNKSRAYFRIIAHSTTKTR